MKGGGMKILLTSVTDPEVPSGVVTAYEQLRERLVEAGCDVDLVTGRDAAIAGRLRAKLIRSVLGCGGLDDKMLGVQLWCRERVRSALRNVDLDSYDIVHAHDVTAAVVAGELTDWRVPVVLTCHFNDHPFTELCFQSGVDAEQIPRTGQFFDGLFSKPLSYLCVSGYVEKKLRQIIPAERTAKVIHNGVDLDGVARAVPESSLASWADGRRVILNVGTLERRKNQIFLIEMLPSLPDEIVLCLVGDGPDRGRLKERVRELKVEDRVWFAGFQKHPISWMQAADVYIHSSLNENCPFSLLEAVAAGCPVFAFRVGGIPEMFGDVGIPCLWETDTTPERAAGQVVGIVRDSERRRAFQELQLERVREEFTLEMSVRRTMEYYHELAA